MTKEAGDIRQTDGCWAISREIHAPSENSLLATVRVEVSHSNLQSKCFPLAGTTIHRESWRTEAFRLCVTFEATTAVKSKGTWGVP